MRRWWFRHRQLMRWRRNPVVVGLVLLGVCGLCTALVAWAAPTDLALRRARLSLFHHRPARAITFLAEWLAKNPNDVEALDIQAEAQLALGRLGSSRHTLDHVTRLSPDRPTTRKLLTTWVFRTIHEVTNSPDFASSKREQARFDSALAMGFAQADWLSRQSLYDAETRSQFLRARLIDADIRRLRAVAGDHHNVIESHALQLEQLLQRIIDADHRHYAAWTMLVEHLVERGDNAFWTAARRLSEHRSLPASLGAKVAETLLTMPDPALPKARRIDQARRVLSAVIPAETSRPDWMLAAARMHLSAGETTEAHHLLNILVRDFPPDADTRYLLARCLVDQQEMRGRS